MSDTPNLTALWDFLNSHAAVTGPVSGFVGYLFSQLLQRRKDNAQADAFSADGLEKRVRAVVTSIDIYKELATDTKTDAAGKIRALKRENRDLRVENADLRNKYELLLSVSKIPGLSSGQE